MSVISEIFKDELKQTPIPAKFNNIVNEDFKAFKDLRLYFISSRLYRYMPGFDLDSVIGVYKYYRDQLQTSKIHNRMYVFITNLKIIKPANSIKLHTIGNIPKFIGLVEDYYDIKKKLEYKINEKKTEVVLLKRGIATKMFVCPKCGNKENRYEVIQVRSGDEGATLFVYCSNTVCEYTWSDGTT
jgi:hypothetical protein